MGEDGVLYRRVKFRQQIGWRSHTAVMRALVTPKHLGVGSRVRQSSSRKNVANPTNGDGARQHSILSNKHPSHALIRMKAQHSKLHRALYRWYNAFESINLSMFLAMSF